MQRTSLCAAADAGC